MLCISVHAPYHSPESLPMGTSIFLLSDEIERRLENSCLLIRQVALHKRPWRLAVAPRENERPAQLACRNSVCKQGYAHQPKDWDVLLAYLESRDAVAEVVVGLEAMAWAAPARGNPTRCLVVPRNN